MMNINYYSFTFKHFYIKLEIILLKVL